MTFTYTPATPTNITRVRFHLADTESATAIFTDEEITFIINENAGNWQQAVISCIRVIIAKIGAEVDFQADWLRVDRSKALAGYRVLLAQKQAELGVTGVVSRAQPVYRGDSDQTEAPEW